MILGDCSFCHPKIPCLHPLNNISHWLNYICHMMVCGTSAWLDQETEVWVLSKIIWRFKILRWNHCMKNGCSYRDVHYGFLKSCFQALRWALLLFLSMLQKTDLTRRIILTQKQQAHWLTTSDWQVLIQ